MLTSVDSAMSRVLVSLLNSGMKVSGCFEYHSAQRIVSFCPSTVYLSQVASMNCGIQNKAFMNCGIQHGRYTRSVFHDWPSHSVSKCLFIFKMRYWRVRDEM